MLLKKVDKVEKRKFQGLDTSQEKTSKSQLAKLGRSIMHQVGI